MTFTSFMGRTLFSALFVFSAWQKYLEFGMDGGPSAKLLAVKTDLVRTHVAGSLGVVLPEVDEKYLLMTGIVLEGLGGILFTVGSNLGAIMLLLFLAAVTPVMHDFYNYEPLSPQFTTEFFQFMKNLSLVGALLFFMAMRSSRSVKTGRKKTKPKTN
eukprot:TRINITY_DN2782_c0_g1_i1.p1 TRINITY_DN2782_c0_g1~~TRINITY_DN2782_c0_g1_i1.p1  ORF type:complete len:157 (+),score=26.71 TRINITY_DN2782_c0_g1_i1:330-800(+)